MSNVTMEDEAREAVLFYLAQGAGPIDAKEAKTLAATVAKYVRRRGSRWYYEDFAGDECGPFRSSREAIWSCAESFTS